MRYEKRGENREDDCDELLSFAKKRVKEVDELLTKTMTKEIDPYSISNILFEKVKESSN